MTVIKVVWIALCIHTLLSYWLHESAWSDGELSILYILKMMLLTFPMGLLGAFLGVIIGVAVETGLTKIGLDLAISSSEKLTFAIGWFLMCVAGFLQWFVIIPIIYRWFLQKFFGK